MSESASAAEIRTAYRDLVGRYHPDRHQDSPLADLATEKVAEINAAYEVLSDPARRAAYDASLHPPQAHGAPRVVTQKTVVRAILLTAGLLILLRLAPLLIRAIANLVRLLLRVLEAMEGTPLIAVLFLAAVTGAVLLVLRRRRKRRKR